MNYEKPNKATLINDTSAVTGRFYKIVVLQEAVFSTLTAGNWNSTPTGISLPAGLELLGAFTAITLDSGSIVAYTE